MIELDSNKWSGLTHAYGKATDIPDLLRQLEQSTIYAGEDKEEPWWSLWGALCHQGEIYTASYATVPHLIRIAQNKENPQLKLRCVELIGSIHCYRVAAHQAEIPDFINGSYTLAIEKSLKLCQQLIVVPFGQEDLKSLLGSIAAFQGHNKIGSMIYDLSEEVECEACMAIFPANGISAIT